jgi:hypothetical protein
MHRHATVILLLVLLVPGARAQTAPPAEAFQVLPPQPEGPRVTPYLAYQVAMAWRQDEARRHAFEAIRTEADLRRVQGQLRTRLLDAIGGLPETRSPLHATVTGRIQMAGYHIEKVTFESLPGIVVTALVYVPAGGGRHPAVLVPCGHSANGKVHYREICQRLVARGYVVICWDPIGQGERSQFWDAAAGRSRYNLICGEHAVLGNLAVLAGASLARWEVWDGIRAVDYLLTRADVDPARVSITGTSGGGLQAAFIGALDPRITTVAPSCYITSLPMRAANRIFEDPDTDPEQDPYGLISAGIDHAGLLALIYPRPVFVAAAVLDFFPIEGARRTVREATALYRKFGHADRIAFAQGFHKHQYSDENQAAAMAFLDRFNGLPAGAPLASGTPIDEASLRVTRSGQVRLDHPDGRSLADDIREYARTHRPRRPASLSADYFGPGHPAIGSWRVAPYDGSGAASNQVQWESKGATTIDDVAIDRYAIHHSDGLVMPLLHLHRRTRAARGVLLWVGDRGKVGPADWPEVRRHLSDGYDVVSFDARGLGETRMRFTVTSIDDPTLVVADFERAYVNPLSSVLANYVYNAMLTGRPYLLQLIEDVEIADRFARIHLGATDVSIAGSGTAATLAYHAADVLPRLRLVGGDAQQALSWSGIVETKREIWPIEYLYPGGAHLH